MRTTIERPFKPTDLNAIATESFALLTLAQQLMSDKAYTEHGRAGLTLVRSEGLTLVLTVVRAGRACEQHTWDDVRLSDGLPAGQGASARPRQGRAVPEGRKGVQPCNSKIL